MKKLAILLAILLAMFVVSCDSITDSTIDDNNSNNSENGGSTDNNTGGDTTTDEDTYPKDDTYNGASYNIYTNEYNRFTPKTSSGDRVQAGVGIYDIWYDTSSRIIKYSSGSGSGTGVTDTVSFNVILSSANGDYIASASCNPKATYLSVSDEKSLALIDSSVVISADTRMYVQFTKWITASCDGVFYFGTFTPAEFNQ